jgi:hypothetical protein
MADLICRRFARMDGPAPFSDAICLTQDQWDALSANDLVAMQDARFDAWIAVINAPPPDPGSEPPADPPARDPD